MSMLHRLRNLFLWCMGLDKDWRVDVTAPLMSRLLLSFGNFLYRIRLPWVARQVVWLSFVTDRRKREWMKAER